MTEKDPSSDPGTEALCEVTILATSDLHMALMPHDYVQDRPTPCGSMSRLATLVDAIRRERPNCLYVDNGDLLQGSPLGDVLAAGFRGIHPAVAALNRMGCDAMALGNHDLDYGLDRLRRMLSGASFPILCANLVDPDSGAALFAPYTVLDRRVTARDGRQLPLRIGIVAVMPARVAIWNRAHLRGRAALRDNLRTVAETVPLLRRAGADLVLVLCHSGLAPPGRGAGDEHAAGEIAALPGVDAVVAGHSHDLFPGPQFHALPRADATAGTVCGRPLVLPGDRGLHLGAMDLSLARPADGAWQVVTARARLIPVDDAVPPDAEILRLGRSGHRRTRTHLRQEAGATTFPLHGFLSQVRSCDGTRLVAQGVARTVARALADGPLAGLPVLGAAAPPRSAARTLPDDFLDLPAGPLQLRHVAALCPFANMVAALRLSGAEIAEWLEHAAGAFCRIVPGRTEQPLLDEAFPAYNFDLIEGLTYRIDPSVPARYDVEGNLLRPEARRIRDLRHCGRPIDPDRTFILATNSYRAAGGGGFPGAGSDDRIVLELPVTSRDALADELRRDPPARLPRQPVWQFVPLPDTAAEFVTGPGVVPHLPLPGLTPLGPAPSGHLRLRLAF